MEDQEFSQATLSAFAGAEDYSHIPKGETLDWTPEEEEEEALQVEPEEVAPVEEATGPTKVERGGQQEAGAPLQGLAKAFEENVGIPVVDFFDNITGNNRTPEQIAQDRQKARTETDQLTEDFKQNQPEAAKAVTGSFRGAAEQTLGAAEVLGDTIKSIPSLVGLAEEDGKNTPWSNQYEWAQWNLGKDEYGAQTPIGQVAQGFGEFAIIMGATGGFRGVVGAGSKMAAATTTAGKAKVVASTAAMEGLYGMAADFIDGLGGNDNLSNLIKEHAPDWYPTWLTALAVDDGDGPYANALKNMFEGFGLGAMVGAIGAPIAGMAAVRNLPAGAAKEAKVEAFVEAAQRTLNDTTTIDVPAGAKQVFNRLKELGDETHFQRFRPVMDQYEKGIPVTWDDIANVFPEYFTPAARQLPNDFNGGIYRAIEDLGPNGGFTRNPFTGAEPAEGFAVAIDGASISKFDHETVQAFLQKHADVLSREDVYLGAWKAPDTGVVEIELSRVVPDRAQAELLGQAFDQKGIYDVQGDSFIPTWGSDVLRESKNGHLKGPMAAPSPSKLTPDFTKAAGDAITTPRQGQRLKTATRSPLTKSRIQAIKKGMGGDPNANNKKWIDSLVRANRVKVQEVADYLKISPREVGERALKTFNENIKLPYAEMNLPKMAFGTSEVLTDEGIVTVNALMKALSSELHKEIKAVGDLGAAGMDNTVHAVEMIDTLGALMRVHHETASTAGRMLYNHQIDLFGKKFNVPGTDLNKSDKLFKTGMEKMDEMLKALADGSPKARLKAQKMASQLALADGNPAKMRGIWDSFWVEGQNIAFRSFFNSLLSNTETHIVNGLSSTTNAWLRPLAGALGTGDFRHMRAAQWNFKRNLDESWSQAMMAWKTGEPVSDTSKKMTHGVGSEETTNALAVLKETAEVTGDKNLAMGVRMLEFTHGLVDNPWLSWPNKLMTTTDEFMKAWTARIEYQNRTFTQALEAGDDSGRSLWDTFDALLEKNRADAIDETGEILDPDVLSVAQEGNFQQALKGNAAAFGAAVGENPLLRIFFPFVKTGHNITVFGMEHTPILARATSEYKAVMDPNNTDEWAKAVMRGRERIGFGLVGSAGLMYMSGNITGAPDPNATQRQIQARPPYSIKVGDKWVDYSRMAPFDFPLRFVTTVGDAVSKGFMNEEQGSYMMSYLAYTLTANLTQRSVTAGLRPLGILLNPQGNTAENISATVLGIGNSFLPASSQRRQVNNIFRPFKMEFENQLARFTDTFTFGAKGGGAIHYDMLDGTPVKNLNSGMNATLNPMNVHDRGTSPGRDWLEDLQYDKNMVFTTMGGIKLKPEHRSAISKKMGELGLGKALDEFASNPKWEEDRALFIKLAQANKVEGDYKQVFPFYFKTHDLIMKYRDMAVRSLDSDPEFAELAEEIRYNQHQKNKTKFASRGDNYLQQLAEQHGIN